MTQREIACTPADLFAVLQDGWLSGLWVVGAGRIRDVDADWPAPGSKIHHSVGVWPLLIDDTTDVVAVDPDRSLRLRAKAWPGGEADVLITIAPTPAGCLVSIAEDAAAGPGRLIPPPLRKALLHWRNTESLRRLDFLVRGRQKS